MQRPFEATRQRLADEFGLDPSLARLHITPAGSPEGLAAMEGADVVVVDPPRKGLEPELLQALASGKGSTQRLIYLSCGFKALMRDADSLLAGGKWRLVDATAFLFFPGTDAIETLAVFDRA